MTSGVLRSSRRRLEARGGGRVFPTVTCPAGRSLGV